MKRDFIVRRSITLIDGKPHVETYSEQELIRCKDCKHFAETQMGKPREVNRRYACDEFNPAGDWFCADGEHK